MRRPKNQGAAEDFGKCLAELHEDAGSPSYDRMSKDMDKFGIDVTGDAIRRAHAGLTDPSQVSAEMLLGLVRYYEVPEARLGFVAASRLRTVYALAGGDPGLGPGGPISAESGSPCTRPPQASEALILDFRRAS